MILILRETIGYHRRTASIPLSCFMKKCALSNTGILNSVISLEKKGLVTVKRFNDQKTTNKYTIKIESSNNKKLVNSVHETSELSSPELVNSVHTLKEKEINSKEEEEELPLQSFLSDEGEKERKQILASEKKKLVKRRMENENFQAIDMMKADRKKLVTRGMKLTDEEWNNVCLRFIQRSKVAEIDPIVPYFTVLIRERAIPCLSPEERQARLVKKNKDFAEKHLAKLEGMPIGKNKVHNLYLLSKYLEIVPKANCASKVFAYDRPKFLDEVRAFFEKIGEDITVFN